MPAAIDGSNTVCSYSNKVLSDVRLKKNVFSISSDKNPLSMVSKLRGVYFNWNTDEAGAKLMGSQTELGMIAQEVERVIPEIVGERPDGYKTVDYSKMVPVLVEAVKELNKTVNVQGALIGRMRAALESVGIQGV